MEGAIGPSKRKRSFFEDDFGDDGESSKASKQKKVRFPKGKKGKIGIDVRTVEAEANDGEELFNSKDARHAAEERAKRRNQLNAEILSGQATDSGAEISYEDSENLVDGGIQIEPFNLDKEREEGYFDAQGNFVEFINENDSRDPWLDSLDSNANNEKKYSKKPVMSSSDTEDAYVLSSEDIGNMKRRIADVLKPGETVLQALRRLKDNSDGKKHKMSAEIQQIFDQLTEDANKLLEEGEYNVYHEKQEVFIREAEGYEKLRRAKDNDGSNPFGESKEENSRDESESYDMFADEDNSASKTSEVTTVLTSDSSNINSSNLSESDYVYDGASGYYYSNSTGYYYDPSTGYYCHATSGQWYSYNQENGMYEEILQST